MERKASTPQPEAYPIKPPPALFQLARFMVRRNIPGGWRLWLDLHRRGALNQISFYPAKGAAREAPLYVPLYRRVSSWSHTEIAEYCADVVAATLRRAASQGLPIALVDCGADIGMMSSAMARDCRLIDWVVAFEPNREAYRFLEMSFAKWPLPARAINAAVGAKTGRGRLASAPGGNEHAFFIVQDPAGSIDVRRVDDLEISADHLLLLKIDVEGAEHDVVTGALGALKAAPNFVVVFEAHPKVVARVRIDPCETVRLLNTLAPLDIDVAEFPGVRIDPAQPFFNQLGAGPETICNVVCTSRKTA